jgi:hypothetical protein
VTAQDDPDRGRARAPHLGDVQAELEARAPPGHPHHAAAEAVPGQGLPVGGGGQGDPGVRVQVVHVSGLDQPVHRGVDGRGRAALAVQAEVEGGDHLVLVLGPAVRPGQRAQPVEPQHGQAVGGEGAQVPPDPFTHSSSTGRPVTGSSASAFTEALPPA